ncbi:hypothetical protein B0H13DRAFT_2278684 [Mycena leptocephala]|nr:hypothetical protein B0H13DRAFT_2278684 [Mycena leptocephala]
MAMMFSRFFTWKLGVSLFLSSESPTARTLAATSCRVPTLHMQLPRETYEDCMKQSEGIEQWTNDIYKPAPSGYRHRPNGARLFLLSDPFLTADNPCPLPLTPNVVPQPAYDSEPFNFPLAHTICVGTAQSEADVAGEGTGSGAAATPTAAEPELDGR